MKIALAAAKLIDRDITFNLSQIKRYMQEAKQQGAELVCFGESFYQGFECFDWEYERDKNMAITLDSPEFSTLLQLTAQIGVDLMLGFMEREGEALYSSCALLSGGKLLHRYRRISKNWKEFQITDHHYQEGTTVEPFLYRGKTCLIALCGDLWIYPERFCQNADLLFWPVFVNFSIADWENTELVEYAKQANLACRNTLLVNSVVDSRYPAFGGCCYFADGMVKAARPMGEEGLLLVDI